MADFVHCNSCYKQPSAQGDNTFFLTSCLHILCKNCLPKEAGDPILCTICKHVMKAVEINSAMDPKLQDLFKPPKQLIAEKLSVLKRKYNFQQMLASSLLNHLKKQRAKLEQLMQYCQKQAKMTKDKEKEMADLREWVNTAEIKLKENEQEKACLQKEIDELKKLNSRFADELPPREAISLGDNFGTSDMGEQSFPSFLHTTSDMDVSGTLGSMAYNLSSPLSSANNSAVSEMTTPKMLGLRKKGPGNSGGASRKTPTGLDAQNPYAEVFSRSSSLQKYVKHYRS
ncbi:hypothetical protein COOONC_16373 [Cooperia oncophora]